MNKQKLLQLEREFNDLLRIPHKSQKELNEQEQKRLEFEALLREEEKPIVNDLLLYSGLEINSVWDLVNSSEDYKEAIPVLLNHLEKPYHTKTKEGIVRALAIKEAKGIAGPALIREFHKTPKEKVSLRWAIGNSIVEVITENDQNSVIEIIKNKENGRARQMFATALGKVKTDKAESALIDFLDDEEIAPHALDALGKLKSNKAKEKIQYLFNHPKPLIRKKAQKILKKIC